MVTEVAALHENGVTILALRAAEALPEGAILMTVSDEDDPQDVATGTDGLCLEIGDQFFSAYHAVASVHAIGADRVRIDLSGRGREVFAMPDFILDFSQCPGEPLDRLASFLKRCDIPFAR